MQIFLKLIFIITVVLSLSSCKKNQTGGKASIKGTIKHHDKPIPNAYVYIKYNSSEFPGADDKLYDTYAQADSYGNYSISFYKGTYYLFAVGYDLDVPPPYEVKGGLSVTVKKKDNITLDIAVSED